MNERSRIFWPPNGKGKAPPRDANLRPCDHEGCAEAGDFRAPKSREALTEYYWFCLDHVRAYNASWNYYEGLDADEIESMLRNDVTWQRPTWPMGSRSAFRFDKLRDGFGVFGDEFGEAPPAPPGANSSELAAMREMNLTAPLTVELVRTRYKELCKLHHPDTNGGDKEAEERFKRIGQAYKTLMESLL